MRDHGGLRLMEVYHPSRNFAPEQARMFPGSVETDRTGLHY